MTVSSKDSFFFDIENNKINFRSGNYETSSRNKWDVDWHCNAEYEIHIILNGTCTVSISDNIVSLNAGDLLIISPGCYHSSKTTSDTLDHYASGFFILNGSLKTILNTKVYPYIVLKTSKKLQQMCYQCFDEYENVLFYSEVMKNAISTQIFVEVLRILNIGFQTAKESSNGNIVDTLDQFFEEYHNVSNAEKVLSNELSMSTRQLNRTIIKFYGMTFREKLIDARLEHAKWLLIHTNSSIDSISKIVGYSSSTAFYNMFKSKTGISPLTYKKEKKNG